MGYNNYTLVISESRELWSKFNALVKENGSKYFVSADLSFFTLSNLLCVVALYISFLQSSSILSTKYKVN